MAGIRIQSRGDFHNTERFLAAVSGDKIFNDLARYAKVGLDSLRLATPIETGMSADSWGYEVAMEDGNYSIIWTNSHVVQGVPVVILLQYGHATGTGGYVAGYDFINPAIRSVFDGIDKAVWKAVMTG